MNVCDLGSDSNALDMPPVSRTTVILSMDCSARNSTLGCRHIKWLSHWLCEHSGRLLFFFSAISLVLTLFNCFEGLYTCTDHHFDWTCPAHDASTRLHRSVIVMESRHTVAEPPIGHNTAKNSQEEAWPKELVDHTTGAEADMKISEHLHHPSGECVDSVGAKECHGEHLHAPS